MPVVQSEEETVSKSALLASPVLIIKLDPDCYSRFIEAYKQYTVLKHVYKRLISIDEENPDNPPRVHNFRLSDGLLYKDEVNGSIRLCILTSKIK